MKIKDVTVAEFEGFDMWIERGKPEAWLDFSMDDGELYRFIEKHYSTIKRRLYEL